MARENYAADFFEGRNEALRTVLQLVSSLPQTFDAFESFLAHITSLCKPSVKIYFLSREIPIWQMSGYTLN
jgi:hypothetical protein